MNAQYIADYRERRRKECLHYLGNKCKQCGSTEDLEFDHIDPATKCFHISGYTGAKLTLYLELDKCQLLCNTCHQAKTNSERKLLGHGTYANYRRRGCRCNECKLAYKETRQRHNLVYRGRI